MNQQTQPRPTFPSGTPPSGPGPLPTGGMPPASSNGDQLIDDVPMFKRKRVLIPFALLLVASVAATWFWYVRQNTFIGTDDASIDSNRATISSRLLGRIVSLGADEGGSVKAGDTLVKLDDIDLKAQLLKAEASYRFLTRNVEISIVNKARALDDYERVAKQFKSQIIPQEQFSHADNARKLAEAQNDVATAQIATALADLAIVKAQLASTVILAPFSGVIAKRWVLTGDVVSAGQAIFSLFDKNHVWVTANYEETKLRKIKPGQNVAIVLDAFPGVTLQGKVLTIGRSTASQFSLIPAGNASGNFTKVTQRVPIRLSIEPAASVLLLPGLSASVRISLR
jgi:membrane fusion protein, multidrug efflux system